jgi:hypothetical protein
MNASWFANVIASANETLTDRRLFLRHAAWLMILGAVLRGAYLFRVGLAPHPSEAYNVAAAFATRGELADGGGWAQDPRRIFLRECRCWSARSIAGLA